MINITQNKSMIIKDNKKYTTLKFEVTELSDFKTEIDLKRNDIKSFDKGCSCTQLQAFNTKLKVTVKGEDIVPVKSLIPSKIYNAGRKTYNKIVTFTVIYKDRQKQHFKLNLNVNESNKHSKALQSRHELLGNKSTTDNN